MERSESGDPEPNLIGAGIDTFDAQGDGSLEEEIALAKQDVRSIQMEEDRAIRLLVSGKITEDQLELHRRFITERLESARVKLDDYRAREASETEKRRLVETVLPVALPAQRHGALMAAGLHPRGNR